MGKCPVNGAGRLSQSCREAEPRSQLASSQIQEATFNGPIMGVVESKWAASWARHRSALH